MPESSSLISSYAVGAIEVTCLPDGMLHETTDVLHGIGKEEALALLRAASLPDELTLAINAYLVRSGEMLVLIDGGCGGGMGPKAGHLAASLAAAGVVPNDIDQILLTHMHPDHVGGLLDPAGAAMFPHAHVLVPKSDAAVFLSETIAAEVPDHVKPVFAQARAVAAAYAGRFDTFDGEQELAPGITPVSLPGHSPGHTGYRISDGGKTLLIWGDVVHVPSLQFGHPKVGMVFDADADLAQRTRRDAFVAAASSGEVIGGMHLPLPGFFRLSADGTGYQTHPVPPGAEA